MEAGAPVRPTERRNSQPAVAGRRTVDESPRLRVADVSGPPGVARRPGGFVILPRFTFAPLAGSPRRDSPDLAGPRRRARARHPAVGRLRSQQPPVPVGDRPRQPRRAALLYD